MNKHAATDAEHEGVNLQGADLRGADLGEEIPTVENIHRKIYEALLPTVEGDGTPQNLQMDTWHTCASAHCRAGWVVVLAGPAGKSLEEQLGTGTAAALIYQASDPSLEQVPSWVASNEDAWTDIRRLAG